MPIKNIERIFWKQFVQYCDSLNYNIVYIGEYEFNDDNVTSIRFPKNLDDLHITSENIPVYLSEEIVQACFIRELTYGKINELNGYKSILGLACKLEDIVRQYNPELIITWTQLLPVSFLLREIAKETNIKVYEAERAPINNYIWIEPNGIHNLSKIWDIYPNVELNENYIEKGKAVANDLLNNVYGFRYHQKQQMSPLNGEKPIIFVPLDYVFESGWIPQEHPVCQERYSTMPSPFLYIDYLNDCFKKNGGTLYIKPHPGCRYFDNIDKRKYNLINNDLEYLLRISDYVFCNYTKVAFPALAMGKTVVTFVKNIALCSNACFYQDIKNHLSIENFQIEKNEEHWNNIYNYFGWLSTYFYKISEEDNDSIKRFFHEVVL